MPAATVANDNSTVMTGRLIHSSEMVIDGLGRGDEELALINSFVQQVD